MLTSDEKMRAVVYDDYGDVDVLRIAERPIPQRMPGELLIRVAAASVNPVDCRLRSGELKGLLPGGFPRIPGYDISGTVFDDGDSDERFSDGDRVMAFLGKKRGSAYADYAVCPVASVAKIPESMPFDIAAAIPLAGTTALQSLRDHGQMQAGERVLVNGASGGVGMFAVQIAVAAGCRVDAVASGDNHDFCMSLGAEGFYDYERVDFTEVKQRWDLIFDAAGKSSYLDVRTVLNAHGRYVSTEPDLKGMAMTLFTWPLSKSGTVMLAKPCGEDLQYLIGLWNEGKLNVTIDSRFSMRDAALAQQRVEDGVERGKVVLLNE